jgi:uncharacterized protein (DUF983 family)
MVMNNFYDREPSEAPVSVSKALEGRCPQCGIYSVPEASCKPVSKGLIVCAACARDFGRNFRSL